MLEELLIMPSLDIIFFAIIALAIGFVVGWITEKAMKLLLILIVIIVIFIGLAEVNIIEWILNGLKVIVPLFDTSGLMTTIKKSIWPMILFIIGFIIGVMKK